MKNFEFDIYGLEGEIHYSLCLDYTMLGTITVLGAVSKFSYNSTVDVLPVINGCGKRLDREFVYNLIKDEYEHEVFEMRKEQEFFSFFISDKSWMKRLAKSLDERGLNK